MRDINTFTVTGRLTRDVELKYTNSGIPVSRFSIANNYSKKQGEQWVEETNFFDCVLFGKIAEKLQMAKGTAVTVSGEVRQNRWEQDGQKRSKIEFIVNGIQAHTKGSDRPQAHTAKEAFGGEEVPSYDLDDIPF